ncbi:F420-dependent glucose-6-phosphate dehydrogenase [Baekduia alba]|uniref:TIGR03619 family F420-dependent LLM class oxidoreductase n=1 Tax=Baekduia alba TaxID=2997333 RepID=UPI00234173BB|nr:TIGR03619 family F420-dependent LLM class oxidoreductase [Baekduia alba]WCB96063.1 F420-dependent glucose-6-phosphate dehydrogenase [Baekduia alba]
MTRTQLGVVLPSEDPGDDPRAIARLAQHVEAAGFDAVFLPDHPLPPGPFGASGGGRYGGVFEALTLLAHIAAVTGRVTLGTSVLIAPLREPILFAKQVATLERLAPGRVLLGVGAGWQADEFAALGVPFAERGRRTDAALALIERLHATGETGTGPGVFAPRPTARVPILVGGGSEPALRRAARFGDVWQGIGQDVEAFAAQRERLAELAGDRAVSPGVVVYAQDDASPEALAERARRFAAAGAEHVAVQLGPLSGAADRATRFMASWA